MTSAEPLPRKLTDTFFAGPGEAAGWFGVSHGWNTVGITLLTTMLIVGSTNYSFQLFIVPVSKDLEASQATVYTGLALFNIGIAAFGPLIGRLLDRFPMRRVALTCVVLFGGGMTAIGATSSLTLIALLILFPVAFGAVGCGGFFGPVIVSRWFSRLRGRALAISAIGTSLGGLVVFPIIGRLVEGFGWRTALMTIGLGGGAIVAALILFVRQPPPPDPRERKGRDGGGRNAWPLRAVLRSFDFWVIALAISLLLAVDGTLLATLTPYGKDHGFSLNQVTALTMTMTASAIAGKLIIARIADQADLRILTAITAALGIVQCGALSLSPPFAVLLSINALAGLAVGGTYPLYAALVAERFGVTSYGWVRGLMSPINAAFAAGAARFMGAIHDAEHSYATGFEVFLFCAATAMVLIMILKKVEPPSHEAPTAAPAT